MSGGKEGKLWNRKVDELRGNEDRVSIGSEEK